MFPVAKIWYSSDENVISEFVEDVTFSYNQGIGRSKDDAYVSTSSPGDGTSRIVVWSRSPTGGTGVKSAVSHCTLFRGTVIVKTIKVVK